MANPLRILYLGALWYGTTSLQRMNALRDLRHHVIGIDYTDHKPLTGVNRFLFRCRGKLYRMGFNAFSNKELANENFKIIESIQKNQWDIFWIDKGLTIERNTLHTVKALQPGCVIVGYSPDDMAQRHSQSNQFIKHLTYYDIYFTTKSYNVTELKQLGCQRVYFVNNAFDPRTHKPIEISEEDRKRIGGSVGFIGGAERERAESMLYLAQKGIEVRIYGGKWKKYQNIHNLLKIENQVVWGNDYTRTICSFDIVLGYLRKINRDLQTQRSIEIPACGAFLLAERTDEHMALFEEGKEAEFFSSNEELLEKVQYYLNYPDERKRIAAAGRERCLKSGYSNQDRLAKMLELTALVR